MSDIEKITPVSILRKLMADLENNRSFAARSKSDRDNILSGFRTYISYIVEKKKA